MTLSKFQQEKLEMPVQYLRYELFGSRLGTASGSPCIGLDRHVIQPNLIIQGWANYFVRSEPFHQTAARLMRQWHQEGTKVVTTNYVLAELAALFISPLRVPRPQQIQVIETISAAAWVEVVHVDQALHSRAWQLFKRHDDKMWSLVDCSSLAVMQERRITQAFTTDHHFEQAGFLRLLK